MKGLWARALFALIGKEFQEAKRDPSTYLMAMVLPVIFLLLFGYGITLDAGVLKVAVLDQSGGSRSLSLLSDFAHSPSFDTVSVKNMDEAGKMMSDSLIQGIIVIRENFDRRLAAGESGDIEIIVDGSEPNNAQFIRAYSEGLVTNWMTTSTPGGINKAPPVSAQTRYWYNATAKSERFLVPGAITVIMTLIGTLLTSLVFAREWERGTMEALIATPVTRMQMLLGKLVPYFCIGMFSMALCSILAVTLFNVPFRGSIAALVFISSVFMVCALGQGLLISTVLRAQLVAAECGLFTGFLPSLILSGFIFDIKSMAPPMRALTKLLPSTYFNECLRTIFLAGDEWAIFWPSIFFMCVLSGVFYILVYKNLVKRLPVS